MPFNPLIHHRRSIRLPGFDYARPGAYYVTIDVIRMRPLFGEIINGVMRLNELGKIVSDYWCGVPGHFPNVELDDFIIMPDHMHGIIILRDNRIPRRGEVSSPTVSAPAVSAPPAAPMDIAPTFTGDVSSSQRLPQKTSLGRVVAYFKYGSTKYINAVRGSPGDHVWQRDYYDHIIRDENDMSRIRKYIRNNPAAYTRSPRHRAR
jgi:putative transposase